MTKREVLEAVTRFGTSMIGERLDIDQALSALAQIEESERLTFNEICNIVHNLTPDATGIPIATAIIEAQERKAER